MGVVGEGAGAAVWEDCARGGVDRFTPKLFTNMCPTFRGYPIFWVGVRKMPHPQKSSYAYTLTGSTKETLRSIIEEG